MSDKGEKGSPGRNGPPGKTGLVGDVGGKGEKGNPGLNGQFIIKEELVNISLYICNSAVYYIIMLTS